MPDNQFVEGLDQLMVQLRTLPPKIARNSMRRAFGRGAAVFRKAMAAAAPRRKSPEPEHRDFPPLHKNMRSSTRIDSRTGEVTAKAGPNRKVMPVARWNEFGTSKQPALPFLRPTAQSKAPEAVKEIADYMKTDIPAQVAKNG